MIEEEGLDPLTLGQVHPCDIRFFRERARNERRRVRQAGSERARQVHGEMAEHYDIVADLLEAKAGTTPRALAASLRRMLRRLVG